MYHQKLGELKVNDHGNYQISTLYSLEVIRKKTGYFYSATHYIKGLLHDRPSGSEKYQPEGKNIARGRVSVFLNWRLVFFTTRWPKCNNPFIRPKVCCMRFNKKCWQYAVVYTGLINKPPLPMLLSFTKMLLLAKLFRISTNPFTRSIHNMWWRFPANMMIFYGLLTELEAKMFGRNIRF